MTETTRARTTWISTAMGHSGDETGGMRQTTASRAHRPRNGARTAPGRRPASPPETEAAGRHTGDHLQIVSQSRRAIIGPSKTEARLTADNEANSGRAQSTAGGRRQTAGEFPLPRHQRSDPAPLEIPSRWKLSRRRVSRDGGGIHIRPQMPRRSSERRSTLPEIALFRRPR